MEHNRDDERRASLLEQVKKTVFRNLIGIDAGVYLFGSWARREEKRTSDIDIAIEFDENEDSAQTVLVNVREALEESVIPYRVDLVHLNNADEIIVNKVRKEGILWDEPVNE